MSTDSDINVRRCALESLTAVTHVHPGSVRDESARMLTSSLQLTKIDPSLIKEVDLGPFKHKQDDGIPIRKAAFALVDTMLERLPERVDASLVAEVAIKGIDDPAEECMLQSVAIVHRLAQYSPTIVVNHIEPLLEAFTKQFTKNIANVDKNEKAKNVMRSVIRVVEQLHRA